MHTKILYRYYVPMIIKIANEIYFNIYFNMAKIIIIIYAAYWFRILADKIEF